MRCLFPVALVGLIACGDDTTASGGSPAEGGAPLTGGEGQGASGTGGALVPEGGAGTGGAAPLFCSGLEAPLADEDLSLDWNGDTRTFRVHASPGYDPTTATPLVMVFHGYLEDGDQIETISKMTPVIDERGWLVAYPDGRSTSWNAGSCCGSSASTGVDDVGFVRAMVEQIATTYCIDPKRVFSAGFSNGGMLSHRLACEASDLVAAIGPVSGTMAIDACAPSRPIPVMEFHGTGDFVVPYDGGGFGGAQSIPDTISGWVERNGCEPTSEVTFQQGDATCETYSGCDQGAEVTLCTLENGGHQWPGGESAGAGGTINMDISASSALLDFFEQHPMP